MTEAEQALAEGHLELRGRILPASNAAFLADAVLEGVSVPCIYKPVAGERPLWDFPDGTLAARERAAYLVSHALGWDVVPLTLLRDGPHGPGMVQQWQEPAEPVPGTLHPVDLCPPGRVPAGFLHVLDAEDGAGNDVSLVHEDSEPLRRMAAFDVLVNNADRKGGHVLAMADGHRFGVDHGVCFHVENKLRTVLWGWAGRGAGPRSSRPAYDACSPHCASRTAPAPTTAPAWPSSSPGATPEVAVLERRAERLLRSGCLPVPGRGWPSIPWPAF